MMAISALPVVALMSFCLGVVAALPEAVGRGTTALRPCAEKARRAISARESGNVSTSPASVPISRQMYQRILTSANFRKA